MRFIESSLSWKTVTKRNGCRDFVEMETNSETTLPVQREDLEEYFHQMVMDLRAAFLSGKTRDLNFRNKQLKSLLDLVTDHWDDFIEALSEDMKKPPQESMLTDLGLIQREIKHTLRTFKGFAKPTSGRKQLFTIQDSISTHHDPFGVVLVISPWNYMHLLLSPLVGAIAGGNCAIVKPSEVSPCCEALFKKLLPKYLDNQCYRIVTGGPKEMTVLLQEKFDYIFYTGSFTIGQIIHAAANKYLTPVTLELGGKCPVYVDDSVNFRMTAQRIMWGKFVNLGQTCVCPDYILCTQEVEVRLIAEFKIVLDEFYGTNWQESKDLARIINSRHWNRLTTLLKRSNGTVVIGGELDEYDLYISPTVVVDVESSDSLMDGEIFGPILPILRVQSTQEAVEFINKRDRPLTLYVYTTKRDVRKIFKNMTQSGALDFNDSIYHCSVWEVPFGGVGESGMGRYHGKWSFETFTYDRAILERRFDWFGDMHSMLPRYPPYTSFKYKFLRFFTSYLDLVYVDPFRFVPHIISMMIGAVVAICLFYFKVIDFK